MWLKSILMLLCLMGGLQIVFGGVLTQRDELYTYMFNNYSSKTLPVIDHNDTVVIEFTAFVVNINNFNEQVGELSITVSFSLTWLEERISWESADYGGITSMSVQPEDLWRPQLFLLESSDSVKDIGNTSVHPTVYSGGTVVWNAGDALKVSCSVNVEYFPFDKQICEMTIFTWAVSGSDIVYVPNTEEVQQTYFKKNSQWQLGSGTLSNCSQIPSPCLSLIFTVVRRNTFYVIYIIVPLIFLGLINNLVFIMPPNSGERTSVAVTVFLSFVVYMDIVNDVVPQSSDPVAYIYRYIMTLMILSCTTMFLCIISLRIYDRHGEISKTLKAFIWYLRFGCIFSRKSKVGDEVVVIKNENHSFEGVTNRGKVNMKPDGKEENDNIDTITCVTTDTINTSDTDVTWYTVGKTFDMYCFCLIYLIFTYITLHTFISISSKDDA